MSEVKTDKLSPRTSSGTVTLGTSGDTFTIPSGVTLTNNGSSSGFDSGLASVQTFTSSGTWTKPSGITKVIVEVQGAGGSGSSSANPNDLQQGPGAGGGYAKKFLDVSSISTSTITVGAGGAGVNAAVGNAGGLSKWADGSNNIVGNGGNGGTLANYNCVVGGTGTGGDINIQGGTGLWFNYMKSSGGHSILGHGGCGGYNTIAPSSASGYGSGSGGNYKVASLAGTNGIVIVTEYK